MIQKLTLDIETSNVSDPKEIASEREFCPLGNLKDEAKIKIKKDNMKMGCKDLSPIWCIGTRFDGISHIYSTAINLSTEDEITLLKAKIISETFDTEKEMLKCFADELKNRPENSRFITFNGESFDIPHIKFRYAYHRLPQPKQLYSFRHTDVKKKFSEFTISNRSGFPGLEEMCSKLNIPYEKGIEGSEINKYIEDGRHLELLLYNDGDLVSTEYAFNLLFLGMEDSIS